MLLKVENLTKQFEGLVAVSDVSFQVGAGDILAIIGPNGAGKTTVFNLISGILPPTSGKILMQDEDITCLKPYQVAQKGIARTFQTTALFDQLRVLDNLAIGYKLKTTTGFWSTIFRTRGWKEDRDKCTQKVLEVLGFIGLAEKTYSLVSTLSQEEQKRLAIGIALMSDPKIILLDEPTGGLIQEDTDSITALIRKMKKTGITVIIIEHKMRMIMDLADRIVVLNYGEKIADGPPEEVSKDAAVIKAYLGGEYIA
ncbi:ABC transporter ATP-binding protein [Desulfotruncus alcoholivorax]|uniref:ABC transporter ATP-binding protein n=1 Tax=Desulfotruncus alcoholivorax TaxID=265477 RepID=UPI000407DC07|nr:ABC transporter ATP-binding protein [Desulfotruncus alcoholivorax]